MADNTDHGGRAGLAEKSAEFDAAALDHAWNWFKCHADQRISLFQFYVVVMGGLAAAVGILYQQKASLVCAMLSCFAAFVCFCFRRLDRRTSDLVRLGEHAMRSEQRRLAAATGNRFLNMALGADELSGSFPYTYTQIIRALLGASSILFVVFAIVNIAESKPVALILHGWAFAAIPH